MKKWIILLIAICAVLVIGCLLFLRHHLVYISPTDGICEEAKSIFAGEKIVDDINPLSRYNVDNYPSGWTKVKYSLHRSKVWHDGKKGYMLMMYSQHFYDDNDRFFCGSFNIPSKWYIEKENGKWKVVSVEEKP